MPFAGLRPLLRCRQNRVRTSRRHRWRHHGSTTAMLLGAGEGPAWLAALGLPHLLIDAQLALRGTIATV